MAAISDLSAFPLAHLSGQKVLITGGAGFIGSHLTHALVQLGCHTVVLDDLSAGGNPADLPGGTRFVRGSILDTKLLEEVIGGCGYVFHQAALGSVPRSIEQPRVYQEVNITGTFNVLESARRAGVKRVMFAASSSAYGDSEALPKTESMPTSPLSPYAATKVAGEALLSAYANSLKLDTVSLRYFNIFGPRQSPDNAYAAVIAAFAKALLAGKKPVIFGDGEQSRDFTFVENAVLANLLATRPDRVMNGIVINVATGQRISVNQLAAEMAEILGRADLTPEYRPARAGDVLHSLADLGRARELLGYRPIVDFKTGLKVTLEWYRQHLV